MTKKSSHCWLAKIVIKRWLLARKMTLLGTVIFFKRWLFLLWSSSPFSPYSEISSIDLQLICDDDKINLEWPNSNSIKFHSCHVYRHINENTIWTIKKDLINEHKLNENNEMDFVETKMCFVSNHLKQLQYP